MYAIRSYYGEEKDFYFLKNEYLIIGDYFPNGGETYSREDLLCRIKNDLQCTNDDAQYLIEKCIERSFITDCGNDCYTR